MEGREAGEADEANYCFLYINGEALDESDHYTHSNSSVVRSTSGRVVTREASARDNIEVRATRVDGYYFQILYCAEYIPKM